ncbi:MAG: methyltransferase domain-containing protein [Bacteroidota bacterium]
MGDILDAAYWNKRYQENRKGWDIGYPSTPLKAYIDQLEDKSIQILIPGGGNSYEAEYLYKMGFTNTHVVDVAKTAKDNFLKRFCNFPEHQFLVQNFFDLNNQFDLILEQTFFCALDPSLRKGYVQKMHELLKPTGKLVGVLFDFPLDLGPPFGGTKEEYVTHFEPFFQLPILERCYNSIPPRQGSELFLKGVKHESLVFNQRLNSYGKF